MQLVSRILTRFSSNALRVNRNQIRNVSKLRQEHSAVLNQETLTGRILLYLNNDKIQTLNNVPTKKTERLLNDIKRNGNNIFTINLDELFYLLNTVVPKQKPREKNELMNNLDMEFCLRIPDMDIKHVLYLLKLYVNIIPNRITDSKVYDYSINRLYESLDKLDKNDFLQFIFYVGLQKKNEKSRNILRNCMKLMNGNFINDLTVEELCIICNSTFKTSTKITNKGLLNKITVCLNDNLFLLKDSALFITLLKSMRHNRLQNDDILSTISCGMFFNQSHELYFFGSICHILALYADYFYYDKRVFDVFTKRCLQELENSSFGSKHDYLNEHIRGKDIKRFVWVLGMFSELKLVSNDEIDSIITPRIIERIAGGEFNNDVGSLIDIALYFWMMNNRPYKLVPYIFSKQNLQKIGKNPKSQLRLNLLLYAIHQEDKNLYKKLGVRFTQESHYSSQYQINQRPLLQRLLTNLEGLASKLDLHGFDITQEVPFVNIMGITGYKTGEKKAVYIELLDDYTRIKNIDEDVPVGLMALKMRLLDKSPEALLVVSQTEIDEMSDKELQEFLFEEIKLIC